MHLGFKYWTITIVLVATVQLLRVAAMLYPEYKMSIMGFRSVCKFRKSVKRLR